jgi:hypothetical protein
MRTEKEKMSDGDLYNPLDLQLSDERRHARLLVKALNDTRDDQTEERARLIKELIPSAGVRIGARSVVGAGSVVTRDVPDGVFAAGNPCRVLRDIEE